MGPACGYGNHFSFSTEFQEWPILVPLNGYCLEVNQSDHFSIFGHIMEKKRDSPKW